MRFSIYDILNEAPEDENPQQIDASEDGSEDQEGGSDDFDIDTSLDDEEGEEGEDGGDEEGMGDEEGGMDDAGGEEGEEGDEPVEANTDMFSSLTKQEQAMKIRELKHQYLELYDSCNDILEKINDIETDETNLSPISRINSTLNTLKTYIADYLYHVFAEKSYYENDVMFNRFLSIFKSVSIILDDIYKVNRVNLQNT